MAGRDHRRCADLLLPILIREQLVADFARPVGLHAIRRAGLVHLRVRRQRMRLHLNCDRRCDLVLRLGVREQLIADFTRPVGLRARRRAGCFHLLVGHQLMSQGGNIAFHDLALGGEGRLLELSGVECIARFRAGGRLGFAARGDCRHLLRVGSIPLAHAGRGDDGAVIPVIAILCHLIAPQMAQRGHELGHGPAAAVFAGAGLLTRRFAAGLGRGNKFSPTMPRRGNGLGIGLVAAGAGIGRLALGLASGRGGFLTRIPVVAEGFGFDRLFIGSDRDVIEDQRRGIGDAARLCAGGGVVGTGHGHVARFGIIAVAAMALRVGGGVAIPNDLPVPQRMGLDRDLFRPGIGVRFPVESRRRGVDRLAHIGAGRVRDLGGHLGILLPVMAVVVAADARRRGAAVIVGPFKGRFAPAVAQRVHVVVDVAVTALIAGIGRIALRLAGRFGHLGQVVVVGDGDRVIPGVVVISISAKFDAHGMRTHVQALKGRLEVFTDSSFLTVDVQSSPAAFRRHLADLDKQRFAGMDLIRDFDRGLGRRAEAPDIKGHLSGHGLVHALKLSHSGEGNCAIDFVGTPHKVIQLRFALVELHGFGQRRFHTEGNFVVVVVDPLVSGQLHVGRRHLEGLLHGVPALTGAVEAHGNHIGALRQLVARYGDRRVAVLHIYNFGFDVIYAGFVAVHEVQQPVIPIPVLGQQLEVVPAFARSVYRDHAVLADPDILVHSDPCDVREAIGGEVKGQRFAVDPILPVEGRHGVDRVLAHVPMAEAKLALAVFIHVKFLDLRAVDIVRLESMPVVETHLLRAFGGDGDGVIRVHEVFVCRRNRQCDVLARRSEHGQAEFSVIMLVINAACPDVQIDDIANFVVAIEVDVNIALHVAVAPGDIPIGAIQSELILQITGVFIPIDGKAGRFACRQASGNLFGMQRHDALVGLYGDGRRIAAHPLGVAGLFAQRELRPRHGGQRRSAVPPCPVTDGEFSLPAGVALFVKVVAHAVDLEAHVQRSGGVYAGHQILVGQYFDPVKAQLDAVALVFRHLDLNGVGIRALVACAPGAAAQPIPTLGHARSGEYRNVVVLTPAPRHVVFLAVQAVVVQVVAVGVIGGPEGDGHHAAPGHANRIDADVERADGAV